MRRLAVFARAPLAGRVKSRLSPALPAPLAARLYAGLLADTFAAGAASRCDERWVFWADAPGDSPAGYRAASQTGADLGERLRDAFTRLRPSPGDHVLVIGSDTPPLRPGHLEEAFAALESSEVVIGPTVDGGYWGIGTRVAAPALFEDIPWSTREVLTRTLVRAHTSGLSVSTVRTLEDLDTPHDLAMLIGALATREAACGPEARQALWEMGFARERSA